MPCGHQVSHTGDTYVISPPARPVISALNGPTLPDNCMLLSRSCTPVLVRVAFTCDRYGRLDCLVHDQPDPLVEFYDASYGDTPYGYFVSRNYLETLVAQPSADARYRTGRPAGRW